MKIIFLCSGNGGNLKFINLCIREEFIDNINLMVIADRECGAIKYARKKNIENFIINYSRENNLSLKNILSREKPDLIITNLHKITDKELVSKFSGKLINLHYSILPSFSGMIGEKTILMAIDRKCKFVGATIHYVNNQVDGGEIISQGIVKVKGSDKEIINNVFQIGCLLLLNVLINKNINICKKIEYLKKKEYNDFIFNPNLNYNRKYFNHNFWNELKNL